LKKKKYIRIIKIRKEEGSGQWSTIQDQHAAQRNRSTITFNKRKRKFPTTDLFLSLLWKTKLCQDIF